MNVKGFENSTDRVPEIDSSYRFSRETTLAILAGFQHIIEELLFRVTMVLENPLILSRLLQDLIGLVSEVNLDSHISRIDL